MTDCGVYRIICLPSGRIYIGSSVSMKKRFSEHRSALRYSRHHSLLLQRAWNKHGPDAFKFEPILICSPDDRHFYEQRAIDAFDASNPVVGMNRSAVAVGSPPSRSFAGRAHSDASRALISERLKGRSVWNKGVPSANKGVPRSDNDKQKIREAKRAGGSISMDIARAMRAVRKETGATAQKIADQFGASLSVTFRVLRNVAWVEHS